MQFLAKPLTFTSTALNGGKQVVITASNQNNIYVLDAASGTILMSRQVQPPFNQADIGCTDIPGSIGITGTPTIDPSTEIMYFFSKGYLPGTQSGCGDACVINGVYKFYAVYVANLQDV